MPAEAFALIGGGELVLQLKGQDRIEVAFGEGALSEDIVGLLSFIVSAKLPIFAFASGRTGVLKDGRVP